MRPNLSGQTKSGYKCTTARRKSRKSRKKRVKRPILLRKLLPKGVRKRPLKPQGPWVRKPRRIRKCTLTSRLETPTSAELSCFCEQMSYRGQRRILGLCAVASKVWGIKARYSIVSFLDSCYKEGISLIITALVENLFMVKSLKTKTFNSSTRALGLCPWPTADPTPMDHNFLLQQKKQNGWITNTLFLEVSLVA